MILTSMLLVGAFAAGHLSGWCVGRRGAAQPSAAQSRQAFLAEISELNAAFAREWVAGRGKFPEGAERTAAFVEHRRRLHEAQRAVYERHDRPLPEHLMGEDQ